MNVFFYFLLKLFFSELLSLKCGEELIDTCQECNTGENSNSCKICSENYFPILNNLLCIPCDDPIYGQVGCGGKCNITNNIQDIKIICEEKGCKSGYYDINGICFDCSQLSPYCSKCSKENNSENFICEKCISNEFKLSANRICEKCYIDNCEKCHYNEDYTEVECIQCENGYYISEKKCKICKNIDIKGGYCSICSDNNENYESYSCWCENFYTNISHLNCIKCPDNCPKCEYNKINKKIECINCEEGYALNPQKECTFCGDRCKYCYLDLNLNPICYSCFYKNVLTEDKKCLECPENCIKCKLNEKNEIICLECESHNLLFQNGTCKNCPDGCENCFLKSDNEIGCNQCRCNYTYIENIFQCLPNTNKSHIFLNGCFQANYLEEKNM